MFAYIGPDRGFVYLWDWDGLIKLVLLGLCLGGLFLYWARRTWVCRARLRRIGAGGSPLGAWVVFALGAWTVFLLAVLASFAGAILWTILATRSPVIAFGVFYLGAAIALGILGILVSVTTRVTLIDR